MAHRLAFWEDKEKTFEESKKYSSRTEFKKKSFGAYRVSKKNGWLDEMAWLNRKNVYKDPVDVVYRYYFPQNNAIYVGRTIYPKLRDAQHRTRKKDTVYRFAKENNSKMPEMEVLEEGLTVLQGAEREGYWERYYKNEGFTMINKQPCGSLGLMCRGKWSKEKCFEEGKKYKTRSEFQKNASHVFHISKIKGWLDEMEWLPKKEYYPKGYWNIKENVINEAKKYTSVTEFQKGSGGAFNAARKLGIMDEFTWLKKKEKLPFGYWKNKEHCMEEAKKYSSKKEFQDKNQSAYWASVKYGYLDEMTWLAKRKSTPRNVLNNKDLVMEEGKKYSSRVEFMKNNRSFYEAANRYGFIKDMYWFVEKTSKPSGYWNNKEHVIEESKKYKTMSDFRKGSNGAYAVAKKRGYINELTWLK